ncbi:hypothetical protein KGY77_07770 [Candidatus Bipolaricaulota bacterium]|nr:hypothetical protein [Candidatus Bipolaricaulota bacterium]MBS3792521.1 hypothetical protein [Candidatus Bipolaricaulota bacterium]
MLKNILSFIAKRRRTSLIVGAFLWFGLAGILLGLGFTLDNLTPLIAVGTTLIAIGGSGSYYLYLEYVKQPNVILTNDTGYEKFMMFSRINSENGKEKLICYPVIHFFIGVKNVGLATARDCFVRLDIQNNEDRAFGRWQSLKEEVNDLHPGLDAKVNLLRIFPKDKTLIDKLNKSYKDRWNEFSLDKFPELTLGFSKDGIKVNNLCYHVQLPRRKASEERLLERYGLGERDIFLGRDVDSKISYNVNLEIGGEDFFTKVTDFEDISIRKAIQEGEWKDMITRDEGWGDMLDILKSYGWKE